MLLRLLICNSILDGIRALWVSLNNILLNLIVSDSLGSQGKIRGMCGNNNLMYLFISVYKAGIYMNIYNNCIHLIVKTTFDIKYVDINVVIPLVGILSLTMDLNASIYYSCTKKCGPIYTTLKNTPQMAPINSG